MKLILIPPYQNPVINWGWVLHEAVAKMKKKGQLEGVEVDVDEGYFVDSTSERRDEEVVALLSLGSIKKVTEYSEMGKYEGIVLTGGIDPALAAARLVSKIPVVSAVLSTLHVASLIGERCCIISTAHTTGLMIRHLAERYGFGHKVASVRPCGHSTTEMYGLLSKYKDNKEKRASDPEINKVIDDTTTQGIAAIEKERVDTLILVAEPFLIFEDEIKQKLGEAGYDEIPIICAVPAGVEMAKAMVNMKLLKAPRAYPSHALKAKPEYW